MRTVLTAVTILGAVLLITACEERNPNLLYKSTVESLKAGNYDIDYLKFRHARAALSAHHSGDINEMEQSMNDALFSEDYDRAISEAEKVLEQNYASFWGHIVMTEALMKTGKKDEAKHHETIFRGLVQSAVAGREGNSYDEAFEAVEPGDVSAIMLSLGYAPFEGTQSQFAQKGDRHYSISAYENTRTGTIDTFYFDITRYMTLRE